MKPEIFKEFTARVIELAKSRIVSEPAFELAFAGMTNSYILEVCDIRELFDEYEEETINYVAIGCCNSHEDLLDENLDLDVIEAYHELDEGELTRVDALYDNNIEMSIEDAIEHKDDCHIFDGSGEDYARQYIEESNIPDIVTRNINYSDVFNELDMDGSIYDLGDNRLLITRY